MSTPKNRPKARSVFKPPVSCHFPTGVHKRRYARMVKRSWKARSAFQLLFLGSTAS